MANCSTLAGASQDDPFIFPVNFDIANWKDPPFLMGEFHYFYDFLCAILNSELEQITRGYHL
jgi:hypothetical protein